MKSKYGSINDQGLDYILQDENGAFNLQASGQETTQKIGTGQTSNLNISQGEQMPLSRRHYSVVDHRALTACKCKAIEVMIHKRKNGDESYLHC